MGEGIYVRFLIGPAYFGQVHLARDVTEMILQAAMGHTDRIVTDLQYEKDDKAIGIRADVSATAHPNTRVQVEASIRQAMLLTDGVPVKVLFEDYDVMLPENVDLISESVISAQKQLREATRNMFDSLLGYY